MRDQANPPALLTPEEVREAFDLLNRLGAAEFQARDSYKIWWADFERCQELRERLRGLRVAAPLANITDLSNEPSRKPNASPA